MDAYQGDLLATIQLSTLGKRLRSARVAHGLTQAELAGGHVSVGYVSRIESGQRRPTADVLSRLAGRLDMSVEQLLTGVPQRTLDQIHLALNYAELSLESGEPAEAGVKAADARELARAAGQVQFANTAGYLLARALEGLGRLDDAILELEPLIGGLTGLEQAEAGIALCRCYRESGDLAMAIDTGERTLEALATAGLDSTDEAVRLAVTLAAAYFERGDVGHAVRVCQTAIVMAEKLDSPTARASAYWNTSMMEAARGSVDNAVQLAERALALLGEGQDARNLARLRSELGELQLSLDPPLVEEACLNLAQAAKELAWSSAGEVEVARNDVSLARAHFLAGDVVMALELSIGVHDMVCEQAPIAAADAKILEGQIHAAGGGMPEAVTAYHRAVHLLTGVGSDRRASQLWFDLAGLLENVGDVEAARRAYRSSAAARGLRSRTNLMDLQQGLRVDKG